MKTPLVDNKHIYYCQIILGDELTLVDSVDDLELIGIHHILRVKYIHNKCNLSIREMYKYCNSFDEETQKKVDYVYSNILDKKYLNKMIKSIIDKSENARKSVSKRISNDITKDVSNDISNDITKDVSNVNDNVNANEKEKGNIKEFSFTLSKLIQYDNLSQEYKDKLKEEINKLNLSIAYDDFVDSLIAKGYKYKNFLIAYKNWCKKDFNKDKANSNNTDDKEWSDGAIRCNPNEWSDGAIRCDPNEYR